LALVELYDTTLRDGAQSEGISFSLTDKIRIVEKLDELGIHYIEGGWPGSNPKDASFFRRVQKLKLKHAQIAVFGSTRRVGLKAENDSNVKMLVDSGAPVATIVAKASDLQVEHVLMTTLEENLNMISDTIRYLKREGMIVFVDAEHYFDGYKSNPEYAVRCVKTAAEAGAECIVLCETNGGALPYEVEKAVKAAKIITKITLGIHTHNDSELAVANTLVAVKAGVTHVQGTINGYGERTGNANLCSIIPSLKLKMGIDCITDEQLTHITEVSHYIAELANLVQDPYAPYVGTSAFSHKAGYHMDGIIKWPEAYQHIIPEKVGNHQRTVISELSGSRNITYMAEKMGIKLSPRAPETKALLQKIKHLESLGFQYETAEASFAMLVHRASPDYIPPFELVDFMVLIETKRRRPTVKGSEEMLSEAMVKVKIGNDLFHTAAEGNGPVNALDDALRKALLQYYPSLAVVKLVDYKVRILEESTGTESQVRVLIESSDGNDVWTTVGSSSNIIEASWMALADSLEYWLVNHVKKNDRT
jgi:2-isopropylmalate synthase